MSFKPKPNSGVTSADEKQFERLLRLVAALQASDAASADNASEQSMEQSTEQAAPAASRMDSLRREIELRAYQIYLERGGTHGWDMADWLQAEMELRERLGLGTDRAKMRLALAWGFPKDPSEGLSAQG